MKRFNKKTPQNTVCVGTAYQYSTCANVMWCTSTFSSYCKPWLFFNKSWGCWKQQPITHIKVKSKICTKIDIFGLDLFIASDDRHCIEKQYHTTPPACDSLPYLLFTCYNTKDLPKQLIIRKQQAIHSPNMVKRSSAVCVHFIVLSICVIIAAGSNCTDTCDESQVYESDCVCICRVYVSCTRWPSFYKDRECGGYMWDRFANTLHKSRCSFQVLP